MTPAHRAVLTTLRQLVRPYSSAPLPDFEVFARSTRFFVAAPRERIRNTERDVFIIVRGLVKLVLPASAGHPAKVEEFIEGPGALAPSTRPRWADSHGAALTSTRWRMTRWPIPDHDLVAIERSHLLRVDLRVIESLAARHAPWGEVYAAMMWTYVEGMYGANAGSGDLEAQYRFLLEHRPSLLERVSQRDIASYLGATESTLSRIAKRVRETPRAVAIEPRRDEGARGVFSGLDDHGIDEMLEDETEYSE